MSTSLNDLNNLSRNCPALQVAQAQPHPGDQCSMEVT